jgi:hypothetical protein
VIVTQEKLVRGVAIIRQLEREENGVVRGNFTKEDEPVGTRREAGGGLFWSRQFRMQVLEKKGSKPSMLLRPGLPAGFATTCQP